MKVLTGKDFIQKVFVEEIGGLVQSHPYISFVLMGVGLEFLGKCLDKDLNNWNISNRSASDFNKTFEIIPSHRKYAQYNEKYNLYSAFRCGLLHSGAPKYAITLSSKGECGHLVEQGNRLNLKAEDFYEDFKEACLYVINDEYTDGDKINQSFLAVPGDNFNSGTIISLGITHSFEI